MDMSSEERQIKICLIGENRKETKKQRHFRIPLAPLPRKGGKGGESISPAPARSRQEKRSRQGGALFG
jgi:hypothetical protein